MKFADKDKIVYQIWPRSFFDSNGDGIGDIPGVTSKLDYIKSLGADMIWLNPVYASPNCDYGYDVSDYYSIHPDFGTMADFDALLAAAKAHGIGIIMDLVPNHVSEKSEWFQNALKEPTSKYRDYFYFKNGKNGGPPNNWLSFFGGSAWGHDAQSGEYYLTSFAPGQCDVNWENPQLRHEIYDIMRFWLDKGIAGFRMDVVNTLKKADGLPDKDAHRKGLQFPGDLICDRPGVHDFIKEMYAQVLSKYDCFTVGEGVLTDENSVLGYTKPENHELMMMFQFDLHMLGCGPLGKYDFRKLYHWTLRDFKRIVDSWQTHMQQGGGWVGNYLSNHDQPRQVSRFGDDRRWRSESACALALLNLTLRGTPFIYQGEECGMTNCHLEKGEWKDFEAINCYSVLQSMMHLPAWLARRIIMRMTRDHARTPVQWTGDHNAGFTTGTPWMKINPNYTYVNIQAESCNGGIVDFYRRAISLRRQSPALTCGTYMAVDLQNPRGISYIRECKSEKLLIAINLSSRVAHMSLPSLCGEYAFGTHGKREYSKRLKLSPYEGVVFRLV
ncbi:MAG: alpha-glucosidase [Clostridia bacterium]